MSKLTHKIAQIEQFLQDMNKYIDINGLKISFGEVYNEVIKESENKLSNYFSIIRGEDLKEVNNNIISFLNSQLQTLQGKLKALQAEENNNASHFNQFVAMQPQQIRPDESGVSQVSGSNITHNISYMANQNQEFFVQKNQAITNQKQLLHNQLKQLEAKEAKTKKAEYLKNCNEVVEADKVAFKKLHDQLLETFNERNQRYTQDTVSASEEINARYIKQCKTLLMRHKDNDKTQLSEFKTELNTLTTEAHETLHRKFKLANAKQEPIEQENNTLKEVNALLEAENARLKQEIEVLKSQQPKKKSMFASIFARKTKPPVDSSASLPKPEVRTSLNLVNQGEIVINMSDGKKPKPSLLRTVWSKISRKKKYFATVATSSS
jgi:hypothetical protein